MVQDTKTTQKDHGCFQFSETDSLSHMAVLATFKRLSSAEVASILLPDLIVRGLQSQLVEGIFAVVHLHTPGPTIIVTDWPHSAGIIDGSYICVQPQAHELFIT